MAAVNDYFEELPENCFNQVVELLEKRWTKCIEVSGDYVEKLKNNGESNVAYKGKLCHAKAIIKQCGLRGIYKLLSWLLLW